MTLEGFYYGLGAVGVIAFAIFVCLMVCDGD